MTVCRVIIAGGGTGGHIFPGLAVADALRKLGGVEVAFVGGERGLEGRIIPAHGYPIELLKVEPMLGGGASRFGRGAVVAATSTLAALGVVRRLRPDVVLSVGGYAAGPLSLAAIVSAVPLAVLEPNAAPGFTNRLLLPLSRRAYFGSDAGLGGLAAKRARVFGVPIRKGFAPRPYVPGTTRRVLVLGGSQGALGLNRAVPRAIAIATSASTSIEVLHQTGAASVADVKAAYESARIPNARVVPFIDDVASRIEWADVIVARAGASTLAEIAAVGRAMILVPYPNASGDHQTKNAEVLVKANAAVSIPQVDADSSRIGGELAALFADAGRRREMAENAQRAGRPDAADRIAADLMGLVAYDAGDARTQRAGSEEGNVSQTRAR